MESLEKTLKAAQEAKARLSKDRKALTEKAARSEGTMLFPSMVHYRQGKGCVPYLFQDCAVPFLSTAAYTFSKYGAVSFPRVVCIVPVPIFLCTFSKHCCLYLFRIPYPNLI